MSSSDSRLEHIRNVFVERLTSMAEEMFREVESTMEAYAEENRRLRSVLQMVLRPEIKLSKIDICQYTGRTIDVRGQLPQHSTGVGSETTEPPFKRPKEENIECTINQISEHQQMAVVERTTEEELVTRELQEITNLKKSPVKSENFNGCLQKTKLEFPSVRLVQVRYGEQQKYVKMDDEEGLLSFLQFHEKVVRRFSLPPNARVIYKDVTGTEVDSEVFNDIVEQGDMFLTVFTDEGFQECSSTAASETKISDFKSRTQKATVNTSVSKMRSVWPALAPKEMIEAALRETVCGQKALEQYETMGTLTIATRRQMVKTLVTHMMQNYGPFPNKEIPEIYALGIVTLFPSLKDPCTAKGYEQYYDSANNTGYLSWRLKTVQRKVCKGFALSENYSADLAPGGPDSQGTVNVESQLDVDACQEALSVLNQTKDKSLIFQKMRETFQHRQKIINDADRSVDILYIFPRFLDTKGLVDQDFTLLFDDETSSRLLRRWNEFKPKVIKEAKLLPQTPELHSLLWSSENSPRIDDVTTYDQEMASLLLLIYLLQPRPGGRTGGSRIAVCEAIRRLIVFHKPCSSLEELLHQSQGRQPYLLAVGCQKNMIDSFYLVVDKHLIPCRAKNSLGALDELFKAHFVFNLSYDVALKSFYTFLQTAVYKINAGKRKESLRVRKLRTRMLHQLHILSKRRKQC